MTNRFVAAAVALVVGLAACGHDGPAPPPSPNPAPRRAFYYWRTTFALSAAESRVLADLKVERLYVRVFDVGWRGDAAELLGPITPGTGSTWPAGVEGVPTVYLENAVMTRVAEADVPALAARVVDEVAARTTRLGATWHELQLDCDWTDTTRERFFAFVTAVRARLPAGATLSATIRLHQVKYRERTGVPPVDRGMLMFYNMGRFSADPEARAIFDPAAAEAYLARLGEYPLDLDGALPIWSWTLQLRDGAVLDLLQSTTEDDLAGHDFVRATTPGMYEVTRSTYLHGTFLRAGDILKVEVTGPSETLAAARMLAAHLAKVERARTIALFDLSERNLSRHGPGSLEQIFQTAR